MKCYIEPISGDIWIGVYANMQSTFVHSTQLTLEQIEFDEFDISNPSISLQQKEFALLLMDIVKTQGKMNTEGQKKYYYASGSLYIRDGWTDASLIQTPPDGF
jgi:hypothetical protein